jgi:MerR family copper efflux transcriptional regulator
MRIGDVAERSGLSTSRIRFYERHGLIPSAARGGNGYRNYSVDVLEILNFIHQAQDLGFTLGEIRAALSQKNGGPPAGKEVLSALRDKLAALDQHINEVARRKQRIIALIEKYETRP